MISAFDPVIYDAQGRSFTCQEAIAMRGGWGSVSAEEATQLAELGCFPPFDSEPINPDQVPLYTGIDGGQEGGGGDSAPSPSPSGGSSEPPLSIPIEVQDMAYNTNFGAVLNDIDAALMTGLPTGTGPIDYTGFTTGQDTFGTILDQVGKLIPFMQKDQIEAGITSVASQRCFTAKNSKRRRIKLVRGADGQLHPVVYCAKPHMNPLNAHALRRAAVRLGRFHAIAGTIEKMVQKACKTGIGRKRVMRLPASCAPKRRCR
jgi:hypothetical protein